MTDHVSSADGTRIAYDRLGDGPPLVLLAGIFCTRATLAPLADALAGTFTVFNPDRRGRGASTDTKPYAVAREVEDVAALIDAAGGSAAVYGHSSGAGLALEAAAAGLPIERLIVNEPPYGGEDEASRKHARELAASIDQAIEEDRRADAIGLFLSSIGMPPPMVEGAQADPDMLAVAPTMPYDHAVMGDIERDGVIPAERFGAIAQPTLVLAGTESPDFFLDAARKLTEVLPSATLELLQGCDHGAPAEAVAPVVTAFLDRD